MPIPITSSGKTKMAADSFTSWIKSNLGVMITIFIIVVSNIVGYVRVTDKVEAHEVRIDKIEQGNTEVARTINYRLNVVEKEQGNNDQDIREINQKLDRMTRRLDIFICSQNKELCVYTDK